MDVKVENFTVSYALDAGTGRKSSSFVSVTFRLPVPCDPDSFEATRLEASRKVTIWAIQDAVMRGELSSDDARERIEILKSNFDGMSRTIAKKAKGES